MPIPGFLVVLLAFAEPSVVLPEINRQTVAPVASLPLPERTRMPYFRAVVAGLATLLFWILKTPVPSQLKTDPRIPSPVVLLVVLSWTSISRCGVSVLEAPWSAPKLMADEPAMLFALM